MIGTWRWNVGLGLTGTALTVLFSLGKNPLSVMLLRSVYAFIAFVIIAFILRVVLTIILKPPVIASDESDEEQEEGKGGQLDLRTPDESEDLNQLLKDQLEDGARKGTSLAKQENKDFRPLTPPQLVSAQNKEPEELVKAVRHLTGG